MHDLPLQSNAVVIAADAITRDFDGRRVLHCVDLEIRAKEVHALLGTNGAGKTTLLRILSGFTAPSSGTAVVAGFDPSRAERGLRDVIGIVPAGDRTFYLRLSGRENLAFFARLHGLRKRTALARADRLLDEVGLDDAARVPVRSYSQGMKKRLGLARGLLMDPQILFVDEATHDLDPAGAASVRAIVGRLADRGTAVLWATQRIEEISDFAHRVTMIDGGRVRYAGEVDGFLARGRTAEAAFLTLVGDGS